MEYQNAQAQYNAIPNYDSGLMTAQCPAPQTESVHGHAGNLAERLGRLSAGMAELLDKARGAQPPPPPSGIAEKNGPPSTLDYLRGAKSATSRLEDQIAELASLLQ